MSPAAHLAAQLRAIAARAAEHSSPVALAGALSDGFAAIAGTLEQADRVVGDAMAHALASLPLTAEDREALRAAGVPIAEPPADQVDQVDQPSAPAAPADQVAELPVTPEIERAQRMHAAFASQADGYQVPAWESLPQDLRDAWVAASKVL